MLPFIIDLALPIIYISAHFKVSYVTIHLVASIFIFSISFTLLKFFLMALAIVENLHSIFFFYFMFFCWLCFVIHQTIYKPSFLECMNLQMEHEPLHFHDQK